MTTQNIIDAWESGVEPYNATATYILDKQTAKLIAQTRRAQHDIDKIELSASDEYKYHRGGFKPPDSPNIAYLKNGMMLPPFRCDIVERWTQLAHDQQGACGDTDILFSYAPTGEVTLRCGQSSVKLYAINYHAEPAVHPLPIIFEGNRIKLDFDPKAIIDKAKALKSHNATAKAEAKRKAEAHKAKVARDEYDRCKALITPEAIKACAERVNRLRKLKTWARKVDQTLENPPSLPQLTANPLFADFNSVYREAYGDARLAWLEACKKRDNFKPRSWRSKGLEKHAENVAKAKQTVERIVDNALYHHIEAQGFGGYVSSVYDETRYDENDVRRCRRYVREYERKNPEQFPTA